MSTKPSCRKRRKSDNGGHKSNKKKFVAILFRSDPEDTELSCYYVPHQLVSLQQHQMLTKVHKACANGIFHEHFFTIANLLGVEDVGKNEYDSDDSFIDDSSDTDTATSLDGDYSDGDVNSYSESNYEEEEDSFSDDPIFGIWSNYCHQSMLPFEGSVNIIYLIFGVETE